VAAFAIKVNDTTLLDHVSVTIPPSPTDMSRFVSNIVASRVVIISALKDILFSEPGKPVKELSDVDNSMCVFADGNLLENKKKA
jgi:hypothetical protein